jgi:hypothetical protein
LLVDGWKSFSLLRRDSLRSIPSRVSQSASWMIFSTLRVEIFLLVDGFEILFFITQGYRSTQHSHRVSQFQLDIFFYP